MPVACSTSLTVCRLGEASPELLPELLPAMLKTFAEAPMRAEADAVCSGAYGQSQPGAGQHP